MKNKKKPNIPILIILIGSILLCIVLLIISVKLSRAITHIIPFSVRVLLCGIALIIIAKGFHKDK